MTDPAAPLPSHSPLARGRFEEVMPVIDVLVAELDGILPAEAARTRLHRRASIVRAG